MTNEPTPFHPVLPNIMLESEYSHGINWFPKSPFIEKNHTPEFSFGNYLSHAPLNSIIF